MLKQFKQEIVITAPHGLHTRPASEFVKEAKKFISEITITSKEKSASAKSLFKLQTLNLNKDSTITVSAEGEDAQKAVQHLIKSLKNIQDREKKQNLEKNQNLENLE